MPDASPEPTLHWRGAAELRADDAVRVGSLYLLGTVLYFVDGGRVDKRVRAHTALFAMAAALATAPLTIEAYAYLWVQGGKGAVATVAQGVSVLVTVALLAVGLRSRQRMLAEDAAAMKTLSAMEEMPPVALLDDWCVEDGGSFRVPMGEIDLCEAEGPERLTVVTRLLDRYVLTVQPDRDRLVDSIQRLRAEVKT